MPSSVSRRTFAAAGLGPWLRAAPEARPNILWITAEDIGPHLHACGDPYSVTPNLDGLCARGAIYMNAWSNAPVCAPARTTIISGMYPPSLGAEHMRSMTLLPPGMKMFPAYLRQAGYYCTNHSKEDYNLEKPEGTWNESSTTAHYRKRGTGQPFFAVFNHMITHESQIRRRPHTLIHDPARVRVPAYHPDTPEVRHDWAQYYDSITTMDSQVGRLLSGLEQDGLADDTIIFFFGDHGSGMPRSKRWPYNSGLNVSIVVSIPPKFRHLAPKDYAAGTKNQRLVSFVDLAPTVLSLAGIRPPQHFQGRAFSGPFEAAPHEYLHGFRGRMDERIDCVRSVRDQRFLYIRNYMPHKIYGQHLAYMWETPTTRVWEQLYKDGKLNAVQRRFWEPKPPEELYDLRRDPDEVRNLASSPVHRAELERLRAEHRRHELATRDTGLLAESEVHRRAGGAAPYLMGQDPRQYDAPRIFEAAQLASSLAWSALPRLARMLAGLDSGVRYWAALGILMRGKPAVDVHRAGLLGALADASPSVRICAAEALARFGASSDLAPAMEALVPLCDPAQSGAYTAIEALNVVDAAGTKAEPWLARILALPDADPKAPERVRSQYTHRLRQRLARTPA